MKNISIRQLEGDLASFRALEEDKGRFIEGYASVFNHRSKPIFENGKLFYEVIARNAFDEALAAKQDVKFRFNHLRDSILARTRSKTLELSTDDNGLKYRASVPNTTLGNDVYEQIQRGDIFENSFAFIVRKGDDVWSIDNEGNNIRTVNKVSALIDVSLVIDGAYSETTVSARNDERKTTVTITFEDDETDVELIDETPTSPGDEEVDSLMSENNLKNQKELMQMRLHTLKLKS